MADTESITLNSPLTVLWGVGTERQAQLARLNLATLGDLLLHKPRRYEDRRKLRTIAELREGDTAMTSGRIIAQGVKRFRKKTQSLFEFVLDDGTAHLYCRWWQMPYMADHFAPGDEVIVFGKVKSGRPRTMDHPETEKVEAGDEPSLHIGRIVPVYPATEGASQRWLRGLVWRALQLAGAQVTEPWPKDTLAGLPQRREAIRQLHFPDELAEADLAVKRLALDEFIELQLEIRRRRQRLMANATGIVCPSNNRLVKPFVAALPFALTQAQTNVLREMRKDLSSGGPPMRRLLQGDVGSGKTVVAASVALMVLESGHDVALMAPTELLAEQHHRTFSQWFAPLGIRLELRTGSTTKAAGTTISPTLHIGTHALIHDGFAPDKLGLVIIDEQHKFGVAQRERFLKKGRYPHLLVMTATPIPRTLGLTLYGDLDLSVMDEMPGGRGKITTYVRTADKLPKVLEFIRQKLKEGRQIYVVYPRVEETESSEIKAVTKEADNLRKHLTPFRVGMVHGRVNAEERNAIMNEFRAGKIHVLLATAVIEVGVDVPNATVMLIENADRFGLAQLHQLRGRIGRGAHASHCILLAGVKTEEARRRLRIMEETTDGFRIAEEDLKLRGPGELLGQQQSGLPSFRFGDLARDLDLIHYARGVAAKLSLGT